MHYKQYKHIINSLQSIFLFNWLQTENNLKQDGCKINRLAKQQSIADCRKSVDGESQQKNCIVFYTWSHGEDGSNWMSERYLDSCDLLWLECFHIWQHIACG